MNSKAMILAAAALAPWASGREAAPFYFGNDLSYVNQMEDCGAVFRDAGEVRDPYAIFAAHGTNLVRLRLWHDPWWQRLIPQESEAVKPQYSDFEDVARSIERAKEAGMEVMLGFQFSDIWADPGRQVTPRAWREIAGDEQALAEAAYRYVKDTLLELDRRGLMPEIVKLGNETNPGLMVEERLDAVWNDETKGLEIEVGGERWTGDARFAAVWNSAIRATREVGRQASVAPKIALHGAGLEEVIPFYEWMDRIGVRDFDIMGFSYYYAWHKGSIPEVAEKIRELESRFPGYEAMIVETGYLWDEENIDGLGNIISEADPNYLPVSQETQRQYMVDLTQAVIDAGGIGVVFWEPAWVSTPCRTPWGQGSSHEHVAYFDHRNGNAFHVGGTWMEAEYRGLGE